MRLSRRASSPASVHMALTSAPESSSFAFINSSMFISSPRLMRPVWMEKIFFLVLMSGRGNSILRSMRPGRIRAGSSVSILFVARMTFTSARESKPSSWLSSSNIVRWISRSPPEWESYLIYIQIFRSLIFKLVIHHFKIIDMNTKITFT